MSTFEKYRNPALIALALLTIAAFFGLGDRQPPPAKSLSEPLEATEPSASRMTAGCGTCISQTGSTVDCHKATQKYTCTTKATACKLPSICR